jgi:hypothetical protein
MELMWILAIIIFGGVVIVCMGLSYLSQSLSSLDYNTGFEEERFYQNPMVKLGSKYFHWRPKGAVVITKSKWATIKENIAREVESAKQDGVLIGHAKALKEVESRLQEKREKTGFPSNPYKILNVSSTDSDDVIEEAYKNLIDLYSDKRFEAYDSSFKELAEIRRDQIRKAFNKIAAGVGPSEDEKDFSGGTF